MSSLIKGLISLTALLAIAMVTQPTVTEAPDSIDQLGGETIELESEPIESRQIVPASRSVEQGELEQAEENPEVEPETETYTVTAYTAGPESTGKKPGHPAYSFTASGKKVQAGVTVDCPPNLSFGTVVVIEGIGERVCQDRH